MRKPLFLAFAAMLAACGGNPAVSTTDSAKAKTDTVIAVRPIQSPYSIMYSSSFVIDDPKNAETTLAIWKAYDNGNIAAVKDLFADTVEVNLAGGMTMRASRDSVVAAVQAYRNSMSAAVDEVNAVMAVKSTDKNEHWALVWGKEKDTHKNGKVDSVYLQETWGFDNAGKARLLYQFAAQPSKPMAKK